MNSGTEADAPRDPGAPLDPDALANPDALADPDALAAEFERPTDGRRYDEADISLRAYVTRIPDEKLAEYDPAWSDERVIEWDGNFRDDGDLMLVCTERDVDVHEFRRAVEEFIAFRAERAGG